MNEWAQPHGMDRSRDRLGKKRTTVRRTTVRLPLPSLTRQFVWFVACTAVIATNIAGVIFGAGLWHLIGAAGASFGWWATQREYRRTINKRNRVREANIDRVDDWIIASTLPEPSAELAQLEARVYGEPTWVPPDRQRQRITVKGREARRCPCADCVLQYAESFPD